VRSGWRPGLDCLEAEVNGQPVGAQLERRGLVWILGHAGHLLGLRILTPRAAELYRLMPVRRPPDLSKFLLSPMPGLLVRIAVEPGDEVKVGQEIAVVEAMKMENVLCAVRDAKIAQVLVGAGDSLSVDQPIVEYE
jgi:propionyl-CoA carboxylase alpha chain